jgi:hypothetical protein
VATYLGGVSGNGALYVDGWPVASYGSFGSASVLNSTNAAVGATISSGPTYTNAWDGQLDEAADYSYQLSAATVATHYGIGQSGVVELSGARINRWLNVPGWPSGARNIDAGSITLQANTQDLATTQLLQQLQLVEVTEHGALFMAGDGTVRFVSQANMTAATLSASVQVTFGDTPNTEIPFDPNPTIAFDNVDIWNEADITRIGGVLQSSVSATSQTAYGPRTYSLTGTLHASDADALTLAQRITTRLAQPYVRVESIAINLLEFVSNVPQLAAVLGLDLLARVVVNRHGPPGGGTAFQQVALIEQIAEAVTPDSWVITLALSPTDAIP